MENTIEIKVEFWQKVKYTGVIRVKSEQAELLKQKQDISMFEGYGIVNPLYELLLPLANEDFENDREFEFLDIDVELKGN